MAKPTDPRKYLPVQKRVAKRSRELRAIELAAQGWTQSEIAEDIGLTRSGVSKMLQRVEGEVFEELKERIEAQKVTQTLGLQHIYRQALRAWESSKEDAKGEKVVEDPGGGKKTERTAHPHLGRRAFGQHLNVCPVADCRKARDNFATVLGCRRPTSPQYDPNTNYRKAFLDHGLPTLPQHQPNIGA